MMISRFPSKPWIYLTSLLMLLPLLSCSVPPQSESSGPALKQPAAEGQSLTATPTPLLAAQEALTPTSASPTPPPVSGAPTPSVTTGPQTLTVEQEVDFGDGPYDFPDTREGLDQLSSYKATLTMKFDGTINGKPAKWSKIYIMLFSKQPALRQLTIEKTGDLANLDQVWMAERDGVSYAITAKNPCEASPIQPGFSLGDRFEPAHLLDGVIGADEAGTAAANGVQTKHYTFGEQGLGRNGTTVSSGELWVATTGGYLVKYLLTEKGNATYFGEGVEGTLTFDYELTDALKPVAVALPRDCPAGMVNAPALPDASNVQRTMGHLSYRTTAKVGDARAFYEQELPKLGWKAQDQPVFGDSGGMLEFKQSEQVLRVLIAAEAGVTQVTLILDNATK